jgi:hypothetical protein
MPGFDLDPSAGLPPGLRSDESGAYFLCSGENAAASAQAKAVAFPVAIVDPRGVGIDTAAEFHMACRTSLPNAN